MPKDRCLVSQEIRKKYHLGLIGGRLDEQRIQPSSLEPVIGAEGFILDTDMKGVFRPDASEQVYRTLLQLPMQRRRHIDLSNGFVLKQGHSYLIPLEERITLLAGESVLSSPKSTTGRLFVNTRMFTDYSGCMDEMEKSGVPLQSWLLVQPQVFDIIVRPGVALNQLRFFSGADALLSPGEVQRRMEQNPLLFERADGGLQPAKHKVTHEGVELTLDLSGRKNNGVIGLRARNNPLPVDLSQKEAYSCEDYFEPVIDHEQLSIHPSDYYLLASKEILHIPGDLNVSLRSHSHIGITGQLHFAGFIDNGFQGDLVFEVRSDERTPVILRHGMPIARLELFQTGLPDKLYGEDIGSHYQSQRGIRPAKQFRPFDFNLAARNYAKLEREVLVHDTELLRQFRTHDEGFEMMDAHKTKQLFQAINRGFFHSRYDCETDELVQQLIPYVLLFGPDKTIFAYQRAEDIAAYGEERLFGKISIGVGGHIRKDDGPDYLAVCVQRELSEEVFIDGYCGKPLFVGTLMQRDTPVDRVHFGLIHTLSTRGDVRLQETSILSGNMVPFQTLEREVTQHPERYETWSKVLIPHLHQLYARTYQFP